MKTIKEISSSKFIKIFIIAAISLLLLCAGVVILFDPFYHYHKPLLFLKAVLWEKEYQVPGTLDHFDYNSLIVGSSVAENNNNAWFDNNFDCKSIKAIRSYGATGDLCYFINRAYEHQDLKYVFLNIDPSSLVQDTATTFELTGSPMYLYDNNIFNDVKYLWNKDVLFERIPYMIATSFIGDYNEGESYNWAKWKSFDEDTILYHYIQSPTIKPMNDDDTYLTIAKENITLITDIVSSHPSTDFYIFMPPYSILWWDNLYRDGDTNAYLTMEEYALGCLLPYDNVKIFNFQNATDIIFDLNNYTDSLHFSPQINEYMCNAMKDEKYIIQNQSALKESIDNVRSYALEASSYVDKTYKDRIKVDIE